MGKSISKSVISERSNISLNPFKSPKVSKTPTTPEDQKLMDLDIDIIPDVILQHQKVRARVIDVYDGDTVTVVFFIGDVPVKYKIRLIGIDTPEIRMAKGKMKIEKIAAKKCRDFLKALIQDHIVDILIHRWDKYGGRLVGDVYMDLNTNISNLMINNGYGVPYDGGTKHKWTRGELNKIINIITGI